MVKLLCTVASLALLATSAMADNPIPDLRGTWKGSSQSIVLGSGNSHHPADQSTEPEFRTVSFTMTINKQEGRRFVGSFSSPKSTETVIGIISRGGRILMVDDDGYDSLTLLTPTQLELCYQHLSPSSRIVSCTEMVKQP